MATFKMTGLTYNILYRFEKTVDTDTLTNEQIKEIEHCAYCANMGAKSEEDAWSWFCRLINIYADIDIAGSPWLILRYIGNDGFERPVYKDGNKLFVDVDPKADSQPKICTVLNNCFGGEPTTPIDCLPKYKNKKIEFLPKRITW